MAIDVDALICGGGVTGLWLRALLKEYGRTVVLVEADALGSGQTVGSQGIIHNGAKYAAEAETLGQLLAVLPVMACAWNRHLEGENIPDLRGTSVVADELWYWNPDGPLPASLDAWWNEFHPSDPGEAPAHFPLAGVRGGVRRNNEKTLSSTFLLKTLTDNDRRDMLRVHNDHVHWMCEAPGTVTSVTLAHPDNTEEIEIRPKHVFFTAGAGNAALRQAVGLPGEPSMQRRPLKMGLVRGNLPTFCGHWFDEHGPRLSITTQFDAEGRTIWQLGGRLAEEAAETSTAEFLCRARREVRAGLPGLDLNETEWAAYSAVRAESATAGGRMPVLPESLRDGNVTTLWPTKLTLVPYLMIDIRRALNAEGKRRARRLKLPDWPRPKVAQPPWETATEWIDDLDLPEVS